MFVTAHCTAPARLSVDDRDEYPHLRARAWRPARASGSRIVHRSASNLLIAGVLLLAGCAATVIQTATSSASPGAAPQAAGATLVAVVGGSPAIQASSDWSSFLTEWQESLAASAESARMPFVFVKDEASIRTVSDLIVKDVASTAPAKQGVPATAATPQDIVTRLNAEMVKIRP
ncbi:hypothetical protein [Hydrogenophaga sp.]|uniref:hypothetical protein n=1 Tax=Hydrogenophaga sp. TaxID=1904254 RepID=UPI002ABA2DB4|nr:hypothetical protein [Hydrogenophaga sp.]MDZ4400090.1 hypothetical protein [Hydrogenophaga sp.]